uniref:Uncharacterized protein n=1 Tax=Cacopsylla melanoneura TaxID=428564 RepID=A0A8D8TC17_9HEMI
MLPQLPALPPDFPLKHSSSSRIRGSYLIIMLGFLLLPHLAMLLRIPFRYNKPSPRQPNNCNNFRNNPIIIIISRSTPPSPHNPRVISPHRLVISEFRPIISNKRRQGFWIQTKRRTWRSWNSSPRLSNRGESNWVSHKVTLVSLWANSTATISPRRPSHGSRPSIFLSRICAS